LMISCQTTYYGNQCTVQCIQNDDCTSSYTCNSTTGAKICSPGWYGTACASRNSSYIQPICSSTGKMKSSGEFLLYKLFSKP
jgi:hypothetical protein